MKTTKLQQLVIPLFTMVLFLSGQAANGIDIWASESGVPTRFYRVDAQNGQTTQIGQTRFSPGLDFSQNGVLYGSSSTLYTIDTINGTASSIGPLPDLLVSIAFNPAGRLYGVGNDGLTLYEINPSTGMSLSSASLTGTTHSSGSSFPGEINGIDFAPDGTLYGIGFGLYTIDPLTGVAARITPLGQQVSGDLFEDLDFGPDGQLRAATFEGVEDISNLYLIDPALGTGQLVGSMGVGISGLASVPEPAILTLLAVAALVIVAGRWRSGRSMLR